MADTVKQLTKLLTGNETVDRVQDHVMAQVNPTIKRIQSGAVVSGSKGGNAALASLIAALAAAGIIQDKTS